MMRIKTLLLAGATIPAVLLLQPAFALDDAAPFVLAQQQDPNQKPAPGQKPGQPQPQRPQQKQQPAAQPPQRPAAPPPQRPAAPPPQRPAAPPPQQQRPVAPPVTQPQRPQVAPSQPPRQEQERRDLRQNQQQQRQDQRQQQRQDNTPRPERREQRQDLRQNQQQQRQDLQNGQREEREKLRQQQRDQRQTPPQNQNPNQNQGQTPNRPVAPNVQQRPVVPPAVPAPQEQRAPQGQQGQQGRQAPQGPTPPAAQPNRVDDRARRLDDIRGERREIQQGNQRIIQEGSRSIVQDGSRKFIRHDENERFRRLGRDVTEQRLGNETRTFAVGPNGSRIVTVTGPDGRLLRRSRYVNGREVVIIDNRPRGGRAATAFFIALPAVALATLAIPRERYIVEAESAPPEYIYGALMAPPIEPLERAYTLDEIRYSPELRDRMPRIDLDTITFDTGSWEIRPDQYDRLAPIADGIKRAIAQNPNEVFLIEGHTDAVGNDDDNLSLSDRRAEAVSVVLTDQFQIPPENLTTQGYGEQQLKVQTQGPERINRRVTARRITPLLQQGLAQGPNTPISPDQIPEEQRDIAPPAQDQRVAPPPRRQNAPAQNQFAPR